MSLLTVVMYHYVRPIAGSRYPEIKGLELRDFAQQLDYLSKHHRFVSADDVIDAFDAGESLPPRSALLTFDDGYLDHYLHVLPELRRRGIPGAFYPPVGAVLSQEVLDVNKIHFVLASVADKGKLVEVIEDAVRRPRASGSSDLKTLEEYRQEFWQSNAWDPAEVIYVKRMLQAALPEVMRKEIVDELFRRFVTSDERSFARELYVSVDQLRVMRECGMHVGGHGVRHYWLNRLGAAEQEDELRANARFLEQQGLAEPGRFTFCYPFGGYNSDSTRILRDLGCSFAVTTQVDLARTVASERYLLPRLDTNHLPKAADAPTSDWTRKALS